MSERRPLTEGIKTLPHAPAVAPEIEQRFVHGTKAPASTPPVTCSPKTGPRVMRVVCPKTGKEILDETDKTFAGTDHRQAA